MQTSGRKPQLTLDADRTLLPFSLGLLLLSVLLSASVILHWPRPFRAFGLVGLFFSPAFFMLACWEMLRYQRRWRTVLAAFVSLAGTAIAWGTTVFYATGRLH